MRFFATFFLLILAVFSTAAQDRAADVKRFREERDRGFKSPAFSPLSFKERMSFTGLVYYELNEIFVVKAILVKTTDEQIFLMPASKGPARKYLKHGLLKFELGGVSLTLLVFRSATATGKNVLLFLPFRDLTNADETYSAGRYLDLKAPAGDEVEIDFNLAYSPNCAFSDEYACAIPPKENFLNVSIKAGEKRYMPENGPKVGNAQ